MAKKYRLIPSRFMADLDAAGSRPGTQPSYPPSRGRGRRVQPVASRAGGASVVRARRSARAAAPPRRSFRATIRGSVPKRLVVRRCCSPLSFVVGTKRSNMKRGAMRPPVSTTDQGTRLGIECAGKGIH